MYMAKGGSLSLNTKKGKVREALRNPIDVLNSLKSKACNEDYYYERLYRNLYNEEFFLLAYQNLYASKGNMTVGADGKTIDSIIMDRIQRLIKRLKDHSYQPQPARRVYIDKKNGKKHSSAIPAFEDKLVLEIVRMILESMYEPTFSNYSHGFRPNRSCHTALLQIQANFTGTKWFIEGDIRAFFDNIDHQILTGILRKRIRDEYFIALIWKFLKAGYVEEWTFHNTYSGIPQGSIVSPILSGIYLSEFDRYMEMYIKQFELGSKKTDDYASWEQKLKYLRYRKYSRNNWELMSSKERKNAVEEIRQIRNEMLKCKYSDPQDNSYRRLFYVRYADDWLCGVIGSKQDAETVKADLKRFLSEALNLELSEEKTLITNAHDAARFLGYDVVIAKNDSRKADKHGHTRRARNGKVKLYVPQERWQKRLLDYKALEIKYQNGQEIFVPVHRSYLISNDDLEILQQYNTEIRGFYNYYRIADNVSVLGHFNYVMKFSMFKTFGAKYKLHISGVRKKYGDQHFGVKYQTRKGERILYFYEDGFKKNKTGIARPGIDEIPRVFRNNNPTSLIARL